MGKVQDRMLGARGMPAHIQRPHVQYPLSHLSWVSAAKLVLFHSSHNRLKVAFFEIRIIICIFAI